VLLLTENPSDHSLFQESIAILHSNYSFDGCESVAEVWAKLTSAKIPLPNVIFVDYELSASYGHELLDMLKDTAELSDAPVIVMADSADKEMFLPLMSHKRPASLFFPKTGNQGSAKSRHV
jgi:CheY-like chemotaxis protein